MKKLLFVALLGFMMVAFSACSNKGKSAADDYVSAVKEYGKAKDDAGKKEAVKKVNEAIEAINALTEADDIKAYGEAITAAEKDDKEFVEAEKQMRKDYFNNVIDLKSIKDFDKKEGEGQNAGTPTE